MKAVLVYFLILLFTLCSVDVKPSMFSSNTNVSTDCQAAVRRLSTLQSTHPQSLAQYWDSWGKPSDGIVYGHTAFLGYYDECMDLKNTPVGETNYCIYTMQMNITAFYSPSESQDEVCHSLDCPVPINTSVCSNIQVGVCYPSSCSPNEFALVLSRMTIISVTNMTTNPFSNATQTVTIRLTSTGDFPTFCPQTDVEYDIGAIFVFAICGTLVALTVLGTAAEFVVQVFNHYYNSSNDNKAKELCPSSHIIVNFIPVFSLCHTIPTLLSTKQMSSTIKAIGSLKVISTFSTTAFHVYIAMIFYFPQVSQNNNRYLKKYPSKLINQPFMNITFIVDTFFVISAALSSYLTLKDLNRHGRFRFLYFYINRYFRLAPMLYLVTFMAHKVFVNLAQGPFSYSEAITCSSSWWYNLLFINNLITNVKDICVGPTWHVGAEMQLFIFSPIFILALYHKGIKGLVFVLLCIIGVTVSIGVRSFQNGYWAATNANPQFLKQIYGLYNQSYYRANPYLIGVVLGYILYKKYSITDLPIKQSLKPLLCISLWIIAIYFCKITLFGTIEEYNGTHHFTKWENATFLMFSGLAWSIGISIIIFLCNTGYGGVVNSFLSWPGWDPLVRLSYGVYLFHMLVIFFILGSLQSSLIFTDIVYIMLCVFTIVASFGLSVVLTLTVELPISKVVSLCLKQAGMESRH